MSETSKKRAAEFLKIADQFKLGALTTEQSHPVTANLSSVAKASLTDGLRLLLDVDDDVIRKYREFAVSDRPQRIAKVWAEALKRGGKVFFTG